MKENNKDWRELKEKLADIEHQRWSDWQKYMHDRCEYDENRKEYFIPRDLFNRWERQIRTGYKDLSEKEKESDREQVDRYFPFPFIEETLKEERKVLTQYTAQVNRILNNIELEEELEN